MCIHICVWFYVCSYMYVFMWTCKCMYICQVLTSPDRWHIKLFFQSPLISQLWQHCFEKGKNYTLEDRHYLSVCFPAMFACVKLFPSVTLICGSSVKCSFIAISLCAIIYLIDFCFSRRLTSSVIQILETNP